MAFIHEAPIPLSSAQFAILPAILAELVPIFPLPSSRGVSFQSTFHTHTVGQQETCVD